MNHIKPQKAPLLLRFKRIFRLAGWLYRTGGRLNRINGQNIVEQKNALALMGQEVLDVLDIELKVNNKPLTHQAVTGTLVVANHVSWLDIFAMSTIYPSSFIAKQEISKWPVLGKMGVNAGTVFINRNSRRDIEPINQAICAALKKGRNVSFFPEARTSLGNDVLPFKAALFQSAIDANAPIQVLAMRYYDEHGQRTIEPSYAEVGLLKSIWKIVSMRKMSIVLDFFLPFKPSEYPHLDRYGLKDIAESYVRDKIAEDV